MNVAIFASAFHPAMGGVEELCRQLALNYRANGMDAIIITNRWPRSLPDYELYEGIPVYRLAIRVPEGDLKMRLTFRLTIGAEMARLHSILKKHNADLLHIQCVTTSAYHALRALETLKLPLFVTTQGERTMDAGKIFERSPLMNQLLRELYDRAAFISACSRDTLDDAETVLRQALRRPGESNLQRNFFAGFRRRRALRAFEALYSGHRALCAAKRLRYSASGFRAVRDDVA